MLDSKLFDHTILKADATEGQVQRVCAEARDHGFASVCVNSFYTAFVLRGSGVKTCTVVGFPLGQMSTRAKRMEAACAVEDGADEIDMVLNIAALKDGHDKVVLRDICEVREACGEDVVLKVIIETCLLSEEEKIRACHLAKKAGCKNIYRIFDRRGDCRGCTPDAGNCGRFHGSESKRRHTHP